MDLGLYIAASGMVAEQTRQDQLSNDLANASTPGYKPDESTQHSFGDMLLRNTGSGQTIGPVAVGVQVGKTVTNMTPAAVRETGQALDFAIEGAGFFAVRTPQGVRYTRDGQFTASAQGKLVDSHGDPVLDQRGAPIAVGAKEALAASTLGVFNVPGAVKQGDDTFTGTSVGRGTGTARQGALEESGVDPAKVMVDMIGSLRTFQSGQQAVRTIDESLHEAATQVGSVGGTA